MSDLPKNADLVTAITTFLGSRGVDGGCPRCGVNQWILNENEPYSRINVQDQPGLHGDSVQFFPAYMLYCGNCGYVTFHMKHIVDEQANTDVRGAE